MRQVAKERRYMVEHDTMPQDGGRRKGEERIIIFDEERKVVTGRERHLIPSSSINVRINGESR